MPPPRSCWRTSLVRDCSIKHNNGKPDFPHFARPTPLPGMAFPSTLSSRLRIADHLHRSQNAGGIDADLDLIPLNPMKQRGRKSAVHWSPRRYLSTPVPVQPPSSHRGRPARCSLSSLRAPTRHISKPPTSAVRRSAGAEARERYDFRDEIHKLELKIARLEGQVGALRDGGRQRTTRRSTISTTGLMSLYPCPCDSSGTWQPMTSSSRFRSLMSRRSKASDMMRFCSLSSAISCAMGCRRNEPEFRPRGVGRALERSDVSRRVFRGRFRPCMVSAWSCCSSTCVN